MRMWKTRANVRAAINRAVDNYLQYIWMTFFKIIAHFIVSVYYRTRLLLKFMPHIPVPLCT